MTTARYEWPGGHRSACCFSADVDAESPWLWTHRDRVPPTLGQLEQRRFGPRVGLGRLRRLLDDAGLRGSFYVPGVVAEMHPEIVPALAAEGHEIGCHGWFHEVVADIDTAEFEAALDDSLAILEDQSGRQPAGFRSPAWEMTPEMLAALKARGLAYDSSLMGFDHPYEIDGVVEVPVQWLTDDAIYFRFFGGGADKWPPVAPGQVLESWLSEWREVHAEGGLFMITVHPWISGRGQRIALLRTLLAEIAASGEVWFATAEEIARHHARSANAGRFAVASDLPAPVGPRRRRG